MENVRLYDHNLGMKVLPYGGNAVPPKWVVTFYFVLASLGHCESPGNLFSVRTSWFLILIHVCTGMGMCTDMCTGTGTGTGLRNISYKYVLSWSVIIENGYI